MPPKQAKRAAAKKTTTAKTAATTASKKKPAAPKTTKKTSLASVPSTHTEASVSGNKFLLSGPFILKGKMEETIKATVDHCGGGITKTPHLAQFVLGEKKTGPYSDLGEEAVKAGAKRMSLPEFRKAVSSWGNETATDPPEGAPMSTLSEKDLTFLSGCIPRGSAKKLEPCTAENTRVVKIIRSGFVRILKSDAWSPTVTIAMYSNVGNTVRSAASAVDESTLAEDLGSMIMNSLCKH